MTAAYREINTPYKEIEHKGIEYAVCKDYNHISRYKSLRQVVHNPKDIDERFIALETSNPFTTNCEVDYYTVPTYEENRLDVIAYNKLGSATYSWVLCLFNNIEDGFTINAGQVLKIPKSFTSLFKTGEILQTVSPLALNLSSE